MRGSEKDGSRYTEFLNGASTAAVIGEVFATQGPCQLLVSVQVQVQVQVAAAGTLPRWLVPAGLAVMAGGAVVDALADRQKTECSKRDEDDRPDVLYADLWGWSRHPDHLGDSLAWDGAWLTAAASSAAVRTPAPALMSSFSGRRRETPRFYTG